MGTVTARRVFCFTFTSSPHTSVVLVIIFAHLVLNTNASVVSVTMGRLMKGSGDILKHVKCASAVCLLLCFLILFDTICSSFSHFEETLSGIVR